MTPEIIIGVDNMGLFEAHYSAVKNCRTSEDHERAVNDLGLTPDEKKIINQAYQKLREHGIFPAGQGHHGNIKWGYRKPTKLQQLLEGGADENFMES